ncbi:MAG: hypothetical protein GWO20_09415 [Candidatus Korarchaeota archaeon]|nr:hypothetical protein [Candidatus Korarchaeota archaeon]NIU83666.1 hypothetical protein [Candidatus Thorarchaeota archaeon]NIW13884.1 hypothetical protein [Candidatus Thorarchaeota archaeon]NIW51990.1 hypothetical protein [Candidatus Korarchaeota archaeon]
MSNNESSSNEQFWKKQIKEHPIAFGIFIVACVLVITGALLVLRWFIETSPIGGQGTWTIDQWTLNDVVRFIIRIIFWELLLVGLPTGVFFGVGAYVWWKSLPEAEKQEFRNREKRKKTRARDTGVFNLITFIAFCIYVYFDGNYNTKFGDLPYSYFIYSWLYALMWMLILLGIPAAIILLIVYFTVWRKNEA